MTSMFLRARWALLALLGVALLATAGTPALAGEEEITEEVEVVEESRQLKVFVTTEDGEQTVKVLRLEDGTWVPAEDSDAAAPVRVRRRMGRGPGTGSVSLVVERAAAAAAKAETPLPTILRWLFEDAAKEKDPLDAWFAGGDNVPFAHLRNALKRDGWTPERLRSWMYEMVETHLASFLTNHAKHAGHGMGRSDHASRGCAHCTCPHCRPRAQHPPCPTCGQPHGVGSGSGSGSRAHAAPPPRAFILWNDGSGWRQQAMPAPFPGGEHPGIYGAPPPPPAPQMGMPHGPRGRGASHPGERGGPAEGHAAILTEIAPLLPQLLGALQDLDPGTREMLMKQLAGLGVHALGDAAPKGDCPTCPKDGADSK